MNLLENERLTSFISRFIKFRPEDDVFLVGRTHILESVTIPLLGPKPHLDGFVQNPRLLSSIRNSFLLGEIEP